MTKEDALREIDKKPHCDSCACYPDYFLCFDGFVISGCEEHMLEIGRLLGSTKYYKKRYLNYRVVEEGNA